MSEGRKRPASPWSFWLLTGLLLLAGRPLLAADDPIPLNQEGQVSMALKEAPAQVVVESIVINGRYNFVTKGKIDETVTVNLSNVSIQDALDAVTQAVGLEYRVQGRIVTLYGKESDSTYTQTFKFTVASVGSLGGPGAIIRRLVEGGADAELAEATAEQQAQSGPGAQPRPAPTPEPQIGGKDGAKGRVIVDKLNNQLVVTALPSLHRKIAKLVAELDKPTVERGGRKARIFELRYITPNLFRQAIQFEIPGFQGSQVLLFTEANVTNREGAVAGGGQGGPGGPNPQASQAPSNPGGLQTLTTGELEGNSKRVLVTETEENLNRIENLLKAIDRPPRQVFLDVKLFTVTQNIINRFGNQLRLIASKEGTSNPIAQFLANNGQSPNNPFKLSVGTLGPEQFQMLADYLEQSDKTHVLSNPKLTVVDGRGAQIRTVQRVPYGETTVNLGVVQTQVKFIDVGITLNFSANILPDNQIKLIVQPEVSSTLSTVVINQNPVPVVSQTTANTTLYLHSAHTALIGGILQHADNRNLTTMPLLGHLPLVGRLFHNHDDGDNRTELLITITAKIVEKGDFAVNSRSPGTEVGKYKYFFHDMEEISRRVLFIDEVVDL